MSFKAARPGHTTQDHWDVDPSQAFKIQQELKNQVSLIPLNKTLRTIAGADISYNRFSTTAYAVFVVLDAKTLQQIDSSYHVGEMTFPYIPGFLSFREIPLLLEAWKNLKTTPDLVFMDGQGIAHPRRLGIASHFGVLTRTATLGCAKSRLVGQYTEPSNQAKEHTDLTDKGEKIGFVYRTKKNVAPIFVSPGHLIDFESSLQVLNSMNYSYRIPEPTRQAHLYANELRRNLSSPR